MEGKGQTPAFAGRMKWLLLPIYWGVPVAKLGQQLLFCKGKSSTQEQKWGIYASSFLFLCFYKRKFGAVETRWRHFKILHDVISLKCTKTANPCMSQWGFLVASSLALMLARKRISEKEQIQRNFSYSINWELWEILIENFFDLDWIFLGQRCE